MSQEGGRTISGGRRRALLAAYAALLVFLVFGSSPRRVGDGAEYLAMAHNLQHLRPPSLTKAERRETRSLFKAVGSGYEDVRLSRDARLLGKDGRQDLTHFWLYPALAAPWLWVTAGLGLNPTYAFTLVNGALLLLAAALVSRRLPWPGTLLLFAGPIVWWIDKPHPDVFIFALLSIALALVREQPWWSIVSAGAAAAQYPPLAALIPLLAAVALAGDRDLFRSQRFWAGAVGGALLAALHPVYYLLHLGTPTGLPRPLEEWPSWVELRAPLVDLNVGLLANFPPLIVIWGVVGAAVVFRHRGLLASPPVLASVLLAPYLLIVFTQVNNTNHGGTAGVMRWSLWLIPLMIPLLAGLPASRTRTWTWLSYVVPISCAWALIAFHPSKPESYLEPTWLAREIWNHHPSLENPPAEIFFERSAHQEERPRPVATPSCSKVLLIAGRWPSRCAGSRRWDAAASGCFTPSALCYANRRDRGYEFVEARY
jgi:hypothetical protein